MTASQTDADPDYRPLRPTREPAVAAVLVSQVVSITGSQLSGLALPWFVLATTHSTVRMGVVAAVGMLAMAAFAVPGGVAGTRLGAWRTLLASDAVRGVLVGLVPLLQEFHALSFPLLLVLVFALNAFFAPYSAAQSVLLTEVVGEDERRMSEVSSWLQGATRLTGVLGPPLAGAFIGLIGAPSLLWIDAATFFIAVGLIRGFVPPTTAAVEEPGFGGALSGFRYIARDRLLGSWGIATCGFEFAWQIIFISIPAYAFERYHSHPIVAGLLIAAFGISSTMGNVVSIRLTRKMKPMHLARNAKIVQLPVFWVLAIIVSAPALAGVLAAAGFCNGLLAGPVSGIELARTPAALRPKVMTALMSGSLLAGSLGTFSAGLILRTGFSAGFILVAAAQTLFGVVFLYGIRARADDAAQSQVRA